MGESTFSFSVSTVPCRVRPPDATRVHVINNELKKWQVITNPIGFSLICKCSSSLKRRCSVLKINEILPCPYSCYSGILKSHPTCVYQHWFKAMLRPQVHP